MVKELPLQNGMVALVDDEDFEKCSQHVWNINVVSPTVVSVQRRIVEDGESKIISLSQQILGFPDGFITFNDRNNLNCQKNNLKITKGRQFINQRRRAGSNSISKYKGVAKHACGKWTSGLNVDGKKKYLGLFSSEDEAAIAYNNAVIEFLGEGVFQNIIGEDNRAPRVSKEKMLPRKQRRTKGNKTGYRGLTILSGRFKATIRVGKKRVSLGVFDTKEEAAHAYDRMALELHGDKAILNFPELKDTYLKEIQNELSRN